MFDLYKYIFKGFGGKLQGTVEARKLVWLLIITFAFSACCIFFIAYVSYTRYKDMTGFLPFAGHIAVFFTTGIAAFIYYSSSHISAFTMEHWLHGDSRFSHQGAILLFVGLIIVVVVDSHMTMDGAEDIAKQAAGTVTKTDESTIVEPYNKTIAQLETKIANTKKKYWWKGKLYFEPAPVTRHSVATWSKDTAIVNALDRQIMTAQSQKAAALADARSTYRSATDSRDQRETTTYARLRVAVRGVYFLQFLLTMVIAYCLLQIEAELEELRIEDEDDRHPRPSRNNQPAHSNNYRLDDEHDAPAPAGFNHNQQARQPIGFTQPPINTPIDRGIDTQEETWERIDQHARAGAYTEPQEEYLKKHYKVVDALLNEKSIREAGKAGGVAKTTVQNVKRCMRSVGMVKTWKEVRELRK